MSEDISLVSEPPGYTRALGLTSSRLLSDYSLVKELRSETRRHKTAAFLAKRLQPLPQMHS